MKNSIKKYIDIPNKMPVLHESSYLEAPVVIQSKVKPNILLQVGAFTGIYGNSSTIHSCTIGRFCSIADGVTIGPSEHPTDWLSTSMIQYMPNIHNWRDIFEDNGVTYNDSTERYRPKTPPVEIGNDVWIGANVFIKAGTKIGDGAIIPAGAVVTRNVPPYSIFGGVPAKVIKYRFSDEIIKKLVDLQWWKYNVFSIEGFKFSDVLECINTIEFLLKDDQLELLNLEKVNFRDL